MKILDEATKMRTYQEYAELHQCEQNMSYTYDSASVIIIGGYGNVFVCLHGSLKEAWVPGGASP